MTLQEFIQDRINNHINLGLPYLIPVQHNEVTMAISLMSPGERMGFMAYLLGYMGDSQLMHPLTHFIRYATKPIVDKP